MSERRVALVSGGNRGIGAAIVQELTGRGWDVSVGVRRPQPIEGVAQVHAYDAMDRTSEAAWVAGGGRALRPDRRHRRQCRHHDPQDA